MPFQLKTGHHHHGAAMEGKPPPPPTTQQPAPTPRVSRLRRLLGRVSSSEKFAADGKDRDKDEKLPPPPPPLPPATDDADAAGSLGLDRMVLSFMEEASAVERPPRGRCNCFNGSNHEESDEEFDFLPSAHASATAAAGAGDALEALKSASVAERNLLADASRLADKCGKGCKGKAECRRAVADGLRSLGYDASVCTSRWEKAPSHPAGTWWRGGSVHSVSWPVPGADRGIRVRRRARVHRRRGGEGEGAGGGGGEADRGGGLPVAVRAGAVDQGVPRGAPGAAAAVRGHPGPARADRGGGGGGGAAEPQEEGAPLPAVAEAGVHARQVAVPARPLRRRRRRHGRRAGRRRRRGDARPGGEFFRRVRARVRQEA
uniref:Uncharacterized protein n=1 Tax=Zea mays TaxID=4577 RepID=A0A804M5J6_MAIZE